jgi:hypothetical protein
MHRFIATGLFATLLTACSSGAAQLQGAWHGERAEGIREDQRAQASAFVAGLHLVFDRDTVTVRQDGKSSTGRYTVHHKDKASTVIYSGEGDLEPQTFMTEGNATLRWVLSDGRSIVLTK